MSRTNRKSGLSLTPSVFGALHKALIRALKEEYQIAPATLMDYQLYGFNYYDEHLPSIKKLILDKTGKWVNGKYLYNKYREWKKGTSPIQFTREFVFIYFQTLGHRDVKEFLQHSSLSELVIAEQLSLEKPVAINLQDEYYVGYYQGEEGNVIYCQLILSEQSEKAQIILVYWEKEDEFSEYLYEGTILYQQHGMALLFKNEDTILDRSQFIGIYAERQIKVKPFLLGTISGFDRDRQPVVGAVLFERVASLVELKAITSKKRSVDPIIAQYLSGRRWIIPSKMPQSLADLSPESRFAFLVEDFVNLYKGIFVALENGVFIFELTIHDTVGNATLRIAGHPIYTGNFKVQASGQLLIGQFTNLTTSAPLFMSIEVLPIRTNVFTGDLLGVSRFDKSFSGKIYLTNDLAIHQALPKYRASELSPMEIQNLPDILVADLTDIFKNNKLEKFFQLQPTPTTTSYLSHLVGVYQVSSPTTNEPEDNFQLAIQENGKTLLSNEYLTYEGTAMLSEGGILSIYFTKCNGISNCGQIMGRVGRKNKTPLKQFEASWQFIDDDYEVQVQKIRFVFVSE